MKKVFVFFVMLFVFGVISCMAQPVHLTQPYTITEPVDSAYLLVWKGTDINKCPLVDFGDYTQLNRDSLTIYKVSTASSLYNFDLTATGETIRVAGVVFKDSLSSDLIVGPFTVLPKKPGRMILGPLQITL